MVPLALGLGGWILILALLAFIAWVAIKFAKNAPAIFGNPTAPAPGAAPGTSPPPLPAWYRTVEDLRLLLERIQAKDLKTDEDCDQLKALIQKLKNEGAPEIVYSGLKEGVDKIC